MRAAALTALKAVASEVKLEVRVHLPRLPGFLAHPASCALHVVDRMLSTTVSRIMVSNPDWDSAQYPLAHE
jgi:hypothetical protein